MVFRGQIGQNETLHANGPLQVQIENSEAYYHSPFGTHGTEAGGGAGCAPATVGDKVPAQFRVFAAEGTQDVDGDKDVDVLTGAAWVYRLDDAGGKVPCVAQGSYARGTKSNPAFGDPAAVAEWTLSEDCVVEGNQAGTPGTGTAPKGTFHTHHGEHDPCFGDVMAGDCPKNIRHEYAQFLPKPGPFLTVTGPTSALVGCDRPVTVNARLTVDGLAKPDVTVSFSVTGPTPATPPAGAGVTGADGRAGFTFTAAAPGDYTVTAKATYDGQQRVATHTVRFDQLPPLSVSLSGPPDGQTEEPTKVTATVRNACDTISGAPVDFSVAWPAQDTPWTGQATPPSGSATTDEYGRAQFSFSGDRGGSYTVTATASLGVDRASATHTTDLAINTLKRVDSTPLGVDGEKASTVSAIDPAGKFAYFTTGPNSLGSFNDRIVKFDLATLEPVDVLMVSVRTLNIDPAGDYAYGIGGRGLIRIDLRTFELAGDVDLKAGDPRLNAFAVSVIDPAGNYAYVGTRGRYDQYADDPNYNYPSRVRKIDLRTFELVDTLVLETGGDEDLLVALMDPGGDRAYFTAFGSGPIGARVIAVDLATFRRVGAATLEGEDERNVLSGTIDPTGEHAYYGTSAAVHGPGRIVKVNLDRLERVGAIKLAEDRDTLGPYDVDWTERNVTTAVMDPAGNEAYFTTIGRLGTGPAGPTVPARIIRVDLDTFERAGSTEFPAAIENLPRTAVIDPTGNHAYFGAARTDSPAVYDWQLSGVVVKVALNRPPSPELAADADAYATDYETPLTVPAPGVLEGDTDADSDPLVAGQTSDPAGGSVTLNQNGSFTYTPDAGFVGTDTFTYTASDGMGYSAPATVSVTVAPPQGLSGSAFGYTADVSLFGGPAQRRGFGQPASAPATAASPSVTLPEEGAPAPISAHDPDGATAQYGPAVLFGGIWPDDVAAAPPSGPLTAATQGTITNGVGSVTSSAKVELHSPPVPVRCYGEPLGTANCTAPGGVGPGPLVADEASSTCTANKSGVTASVSFVNGVVETKYDPQTQLPVESQPIPNPVPKGYTVEGTIDHVGDRFRIVFNEQVVSPGGARVTVNAAHMYLLGPTAVGEVVIGQSVCGAPLGPNAIPEAGDDAYTTVAGRALTVAAPGVLANDADPDGDVLSAGSASDPAGGAVTVNGDGSFTYTPDAGFVGNDTFTYVADDGFGGTDTATVTMTVTPPPPAGDTRPTQLSVSDLSVVEGSGATATFTVTRSGNTSGPSTVKYKTSGGTATAGTDYTAVSTLTTLSFAAGETTKTVDVAVTADTLPEANETFNLVLSAPTGAVLADASGTATVRNDDGAAFLGVDNVTVTEANTDTTATFTITRSGNTNGPSTVKYKTANGTAGVDDFTAVPLTPVTFDPGQTTRTVEVAVKGDTLDEKNETFTLALSAPVGATIADGAGTATVVDDEGTLVPGPATFVSVDNVLVPEGNTGTTSATFTVTRTGNTDVASTVKYKTSGGTATAGSDYTSITTLGSLSFAVGETSKTVPVAVVGDGLPEVDDTFNLVLSAPTGAVIADASGTATIVNDDGAAYVAVDNVAINEGNSGTTQVTFTVTRTGNTTGASSVKVRTSGGTATAGSDYTALALTDVAFAADETAKTVTVDITGDAVKEANETVNLALTTPVGATVSDAAGSATIINDDT